MRQFYRIPPKVGRILNMDQVMFYRHYEINHRKSITNYFPSTAQLSETPTNCHDRVYTNEYKFDNSNGQFMSNLIQFCLKNDINGTVRSGTKKRDKSKQCFSSMLVVTDSGKLSHLFSVLRTAP